MGSRVFHIPGNGEFCATLFNPDPAAVRSYVLILHVLTYCLDMKEPKFACGRLSIDPKTNCFPVLYFIQNWSVHLC